MRSHDCLLHPPPLVWICAEPLVWIRAFFWPTNPAGGVMDRAVINILRGFCLALGPEPPG